jgi:hypothetical protein
MRLAASALFLTVLSPFVAAQQELPPGPTADTLIACASAHTQNILLVQAAAGDTKALYRVLGYFRLAGEAYSSKSYAEQKYQEGRAALKAQMEAVFAEPEATRMPGVQKFLSDLDDQLEECSRFQRAHAPAIRERLAQSGLLK